MKHLAPAIIAAGTIALAAHAASTQHHNSTDRPAKHHTTATNQSTAAPLTTLADATLHHPLLDAAPVSARTTCPGDTDSNNIVDLMDLLTVLANFGNAVSGGPADGDIDPLHAPDGFIGFNDLTQVLGNFGEVCL